MAPPHESDAGADASTLVTAALSPGSAVASAMSLATIGQALQDAAVLAAKYGSTNAARDRLAFLEREHESLNDVVVALQTRLRTTQRATESDFDADAFVDFLKRRFACRGDLSLLLNACVAFQAQTSSAAPSVSTSLLPRANERVVLLTIEKVQSTHASAIGEATAAARSPLLPLVNQQQQRSLRSTSTTDADADASSAVVTNSFLRTASLAAAAAEASNPIVIASTPTKKRKRKDAVAEIAIVQSHLLAQRLSWRNVRDTNDDSAQQPLAFAAVEALDRQQPWNAMHVHRTLVSRIVDASSSSSSTNARATVWVAAALENQFTWRRAFWERLHWLPLSESACDSDAWTTYRDDRMRRAKDAVDAWRTIYAQSIALIAAGELPADIWCDPALWFMPAAPIYWLPAAASSDLADALEALDATQPVRCYYVFDPRRHPFYSSGLDRIYRSKYTFVYMLNGSGKISGESDVHAHEAIVMERDGDGVHLEASALEGLEVIVISGQPLEEPVVQHGPFVMTTRDEIRATIHDFQRSTNGFENSDTWQSDIGQKRR